MRVASLLVEESRLSVLFQQQVGFKGCGIGFELQFERFSLGFRVDTFSIDQL